MKKEKIYWFKFQQGDVQFENGFKSYDWDKAEDAAMKFANDYDYVLIEYTGWTEPEDPKRNYDN